MCTSSSTNRRLAAGTPTILVVDDEPQVRRVVGLALSHNGFSVLTAGSGEEAISISQSHSGRLLLLSDIVMPGMDGVTLAKKLRASNPNLPVILMSGACDALPPSASNPIEFISKPFTLATLLKSIKTVIAKSGGIDPMLREGVEDDEMN